MTHTESPVTVGVRTPEHSDSEEQSKMAGWGKNCVGIFSKPEPVINIDLIS